MFFQKSHTHLHKDIQNQTTSHMMKPILKNIIEVAVADVRHFKDITVIPGTGVKIERLHYFQPLPLVGLAACSDTSKIVNKSRIYTVTLTALLSSGFDDCCRNLLFLLTTADGSRYVLGCDERPYPTISTTYSYSGKTTEASGCTMTVEWVSTHGLLRVIE